MCARKTFTLLFALPFWTVGVGCAIAQDRSQSTTVLENPLASMSLDRMSASRDRPLFATSRRPPPPPPPPVTIAAAPPPPPPLPPNVSLIGIVVEADEARAVVRVPPKNDVIRVHIGEAIGGWRVTQIEGRKLVLSLNDQSVTFTLFNRPTAKPPIGNAPVGMDKSIQTPPAGRAPPRPVPVPVPGADAGLRPH
jgi:general secretion pathway protein N